MKQKGFTLIELLVVISIVALLSSVVMASLNAARDRGRLGAGRYFEAQVYHLAGEQAIGLWDFDECSGTVAKDRSGFGFDGTLAGGVSYSTDTPTGDGCSLLFDGVDDYVNIPDPSGAFSFSGTSPFTVSFWYRQKTADAAANYGRVLSKEDSTGGRQGWDILWANATVLSLERWRDNIANSTNLSASADDTWRHIVYVFTGTTGVVYKDGKYISTSNNSTVLLSNANPLRIGRHSAGSSLGPQAIIDSMRIYAKALTAQEVGVLYALDSKDEPFAYEK